MKKQAQNRIGKKTADLIALPPMTWYVKPAEWLAQQETFAANYKSIPVQNELKESIIEHGIKAPMLTMPNWYPITGSQRLRAIQAIREETPDHPILQQPVRVAKIDHNYWDIFRLWPHCTELQLVPIYLQLIEIVWKSRYFIEETSEYRSEMVEFETRGDKLKWQARDGEVSQ